MKKIITALLLLLAVATPITYSVASQASAGVSASASNNWDSILDSYEKYVDNYISVMKRAKAGDVAALTESVTLLQTTTELGKKLENASGDLTPAQLKRYMQIVTKMTTGLL